MAKEFNSFSHQRKTVTGRREVLRSLGLEQRASPLSERVVCRPVTRTPKR